MSSNSINSRMAAQRSHSLTRRWSCGSGRRRRSGRGGKSGPRPSAQLAALPLPPFQPHQKTIAQHHGDGVAMKAIPAPSLILIPAQLGFGFLMILLHPVAAVGILDHPGRRRGGREVTPEILPVALLAATGALPRATTRDGGCHRHPPASSAARKTSPATSLWPLRSTQWSASPGAVAPSSTASARRTGLACPRPRVTLKLARTAAT
jgi:hypothetical protein